MSESALQTPSLNYAALFIRKLLSPLVEDPTAADFARLSNPMLEIALAVFSEGRDEGKRRSRLKAELTARGLADALMPKIESADPQANLAELQAGTWQAFDLADVMTEEIPPTTWLVKPFLARPSVTAFFGKPKSLKSLMVLDMAVHVSSGIPWLGSPPNNKGGLEVNPARVVWLDLENGPSLLKRRMKAVAAALGAGGSRGQFLTYSLPNPWPDLSKPEHVAALIARFEELGNVGMCVIDHLGQVFGAVDENSPLVSAIMGNLRQVAETCNLGLVLVHHAKKTAAGRGMNTPEDQLRGSGAILAGLDGAFLVDRDRTDKTKLKVIPVAVRGPEAPNLSAEFSYSQDVNLELTEARFWRLVWRSDSERAKDAILQILGEGKKNHTALRTAVKEIESGLSDDKIRTTIAKLEADQEIVFTKGSKGAKIYRLPGEENDETESED